MTAVPLFDRHCGCHCRPRRPSLFRRIVAAVRRKPAAPAGLRPAAVLRAAGAATALVAATPPDGLPVLGGRMLSEVRAEHDLLTDAEIAALRPRKVLPREDGQIVIDERNRVHVRPVNGVYPGDLPRRTPAATLGRAPWETGSWTVPDAMMVPVYGEKCVADVQEAERLSRVMQP